LNPLPDDYIFIIFVYGKINIKFVSTSSGSDGDEIVKSVWTTGTKINVVIFLVTTTEGCIRLLFPPFFSSLGFHSSTIGYMFSLLAIATLTSRLPGGLWYALKRRRLLLNLTVFLLAGTACFLALPLSMTAVIITLAGHGICFGIVTTLLLAFCIDNIDNKQSPVGAMALYTAFIAGGYATGNMVAGLFASYLGISATFWVAGIFTYCALILLLTVRWPGIKFSKEYSNISDNSKNDFLLLRIWNSVKMAAGLPLGVYVAFVLVFYINFVNQLVDVYFPLLAMQAGLTLSVIGILQGFKAWCATLIRFGSGFVLHKISYPLANNYSLMALAVAASLLAKSLWLPVLIGIFITMGLGRGVIRVTSAIFLAECHFDSSRQKGVASGVYNAGLDLGDILGPVVAGATISFWGLTGVFLVLPGLLLIPCYLLVLRVAGISGKIRNCKKDYSNDW